MVTHSCSATQEAESMQQHHSFYLYISAQNAQALTPHLQHGVFLCPFSCHFIVPAKAVFYIRENVQTDGHYLKAILERVAGFKALYHSLHVIIHLKQNMEMKLNGI